VASCEICGKSKAFGHHVSHANNRVKRVFMPNIQRKRLTIGGRTRRLYICTRCLRTGNFR